MRGAHLLARAAVAVRQIGRDRELPLLADAHATQPVIPAFDDLALAERELERIAALDRRVERRPLPPTPARM